MSNIKYTIRTNDLEQTVLECLCEMPVRNALIDAIQKERGLVDVTKEDIEKAWESLTDKIMNPDMR